MQNIYSIVVAVKGKSQLMFPSPGIYLTAGEVYNPCARLEKESHLSYTTGGNR